MGPKVVIIYIGGLQMSIVLFNFALMKKNRKQTRVCGKMLLINVFMLLMAAWCPSQISAQSALYEVPGLLTVNSLIREYTTGKDVVFNQDGRSCFLLVDRMAGTVTEAEVSGLNSVADMEIDDEMLYFCGNYKGDQVIGYFDINDLFTGTNQVNIVPVPYSPVVNSYRGILTLRKLEVLTYNYPGDVHVFLVGDLAFGAPPSVAPDYTCLVDAMFDGVTWREEVIYEPAGIYFMDDLTVTQSNLVVIGDKHDGTGDYSNIEMLPAPGGAPLSLSLNPPLNLSMCYSPDIDYYPVSRPLIETLTGDSYATACHGYFEGQFGVVITIYSNTCIIQDRWLVPNLSGTTEFRDLKYNAWTDKLYLVPDHLFSTFTDEMYVFDLSNVQAFLYQSRWSGVYSVDICQRAPEVVSSGTTMSGEVGVWRINLPKCECEQYLNLPVLRRVHDPSQFKAEIRIDYLYPAPQTYTALINEFPLIITCGGE